MKAAKLLVFVVVLLCLYAGPAWAQAQLTVTKSDNPDPVQEGEVLTYTITVTNNDPTGTQAANSVVLTDNLPDTTEFISVSTTNGNCNPEPPEGDLGPVVTCQLGTLAEGETATVTIQVSPTVAAIGTQLNNSAQAACAGTCLDDSSPTIQTTVVPDLEINKLDDPDPVGTEDLLLYQLRLQNQGDLTLTPGVNADILIVDDLPLNQVDLVSFESEDFDCVFNAGLIQCELTEPLSPNEVVTIDIVVEPEVPGVTLENVAGVFYDNPTNANFPNTLVDADTESTVVEDGAVDGDDGDGDGDGNGDGDDGIDDGILDDEEDILEDEEDLLNDEEDLLDEEDELLDEEDELLDELDDEADDGVTAEAGDPDEQDPVSGPRGDVVDEIDTGGTPLPPTGGSPVATLAPLAGIALAPLVWIALLAAGLSARWVRRRRGQ